MEPAVTGRRDVQYRATVGVDAAEPSGLTANTYGLPGPRFAAAPHSSTRIYARNYQGVAFTAMFY